MEIGQLVGDYEILSVLGTGGMGRVYKVRSVITQRVEAMKVLLSDISDQPELSERFIREIRISAGLDHPNIAALRAAQRVGNQLLMVMEFVDGSTLADLMHRGPIPLPRSLEYITDALSALEYAHAQNVIHRDIKPSNIMITPSHQVKLMDFGVARLTTEAKLTKTGFLVGSLFYMSPEQIENAAPDARSDVYAIGVTLYELVTGKRPFDGSSEYQIMAAHLKGSPVPPKEMDVTLPAEINDIVLTALARDPAHRFASAKAMKSAIASVLRGGSAQTVPAVAQMPQPPRAALPATPAKAPQAHRTTYMLAGSLATIAVLVTAAVEVPKYFHARADEQVTPTSAKSQPAVPESSTGAAAGSPATNAAEPIHAGGEAHDDAPAVPVAPNESAGQKERAATRAPSLEPKKQPERAPNVPAATASTDPHPTETAVTPAVPPPDPRQNAAAPDTELSELHDRWAQLDARAAAVHGSLENLKRVQAQSGMGLRGDVVASEQRLTALMNDAQVNLQQHDLVTAHKRLDGADAEMEKLEKFLGR